MDELWITGAGWVQKACLSELPIVCISAPRLWALGSVQGSALAMISMTSP